MTQELSHGYRVVGKEGRLGKRGSLGEVTGFLARLDRFGQLC